MKTGSSPSQSAWLLPCLSPPPGRAPCAAHLKPGRKSIGSRVQLALSWGALSSAASLDYLARTSSPAFALTSRASITPLTLTTGRWLSARNCQPPAWPTMKFPPNMACEISAMRSSTIELCLSIQGRIASSQ